MAESIPFQRPNSRINIQLHLDKKIILIKLKLEKKKIDYQAEIKVR
jgi:hypothetical protein